MGNIEEGIRACALQSRVDSGVFGKDIFESSSQISVYVLNETCKHFGDILPFIK